MKHGKTRFLTIGAGATLAVLVTLPIAALLRAHAALPPAAPKVGANGKPLIPVNYYADFGDRVTQPNGDDVVSMRGNAWIEGKGARLSSQQLTYNETSQLGTSPTALRLEDEQNTLTGNKGVAFYKTRDAKVTGNVRIIIRPRPSDTQNARKGSARRNFKDPVTITCGRVDYNWRTRRGVCTENLVLKQLNRTVTCERMLFDGRTEVVTLEGNVYYVDSKGNDGRGPSAVLVLKEGSERFTMNKGVSGKVLVEDEDEAPPLADTPPAEQFVPPVPPEDAPPPVVPPTTPPPTSPPPADPGKSAPPPRFRGPNR